MEEKGRMRVQTVLLIFLLIAIAAPIKVSDVIGDGQTAGTHAHILRSGGTAVQGGYADQSFVSNDLSNVVSSSTPTRLSDGLVPMASSSYRYVMCHDVDSNNNPSGLTPNFETSDYRACENVEWYTDAGNHALVIKWYYRTGDTSWAYYTEATVNGYLSAGYWLWSCWIYISGNWPASNPRAWKAEFYDNSVLVSRDFCEITSPNPGDSTMCKDVQGSYPYDPSERTSTFQRGVDTKACAWFRWDNMYYFYEPDNTCHWLRFEWVDPSGSTVRIATYYFGDYADQGLSYWAWGKAWDSLPISSSTPLGSWSVNVYMDKFRWDGSFPTLYKSFEGPMFRLTFDVTTETNHAPFLSNGHVTPTGGYPETEFQFEVTYADQDGDNPGDRKHVYIYNNGWSRYDMSYISGTPGSGMLYRYATSGFSIGDHNYFFHFNDEHGLEAYFPADGSYLSFHVDPSLGKPRIRVEPTSLSFDAYASALYCNKRGNTSKDHMTIEVDFAGLVTENREDHTYVTSSGCEESTETGRPMLPFKSFLTLLPPSSTLQSITLTNIDQVKLPGKYQVLLTGQPAIASNDLSVSVKVSEPFSTELCVTSDVGGFRGYRVSNVVVFAARYLSDSETLIQNNAITITLEFDTSKDKSVDSMFRGIIEDKNEIEGIVANPDATSTYPLKNTELTAAYKYVIITTDDMSSAFQPLADWKTQKLGSATVVTVSTIQNQYPGIDTQEKIRNFLKYVYQNWQTQWVLLGGDVEAVPQRGAYGYVSSSSGPIEDKNIPCDLYYSDLDGTWDADGDHIYGETTDGVDLYPDLYVGRAPVNTAAEATNFVNKVLTYEQNPQVGYLTKALLIAYWLDSSTNEGSLKDYIAGNYLSGYTITKYYEPSLGSGIDKNGVINSINSGQGIANQASHGNEWSVPPFGISDVDNLQNGQKYFVFYSTACYTNAFDTSDCIAEHFLLNTNGGAVAYIGNSRYGWYYPGSPGSGPGDQYDKEFFKLLSQGYNHIGETLAKSKVTFIPQSGSDGPFRWTQYCLNLLGDPEMNIHTEEFGKSLRVCNDGDANLVVSDTTTRYQEGEPTGWLNANPKSFAVPVGTTPQQVTVTANPAGLSPNTYHGWLQIRSNDAYGNDVYEVSVTLRVYAETYIAHLESRQDNSATSDLGTITFDGMVYNLPSDVSKASGSYSATYSPASNYLFDHWEVASGIAVSSTTANPTSVTVSNPGGILRVIYKYVPPTYTIHLESQQNSSTSSNYGKIVFDGTPYTLPTDVSKAAGIYQAYYSSVSCYTFDHWVTSGGVSVPEVNVNQTMVTVSGDGALRATYKTVRAPAMWANPESANINTLPKRYNISVMVENLPQCLVVSCSIRIADYLHANITNYYKGADFNTLGFSIFTIGVWDKSHSDLQGLTAATLIGTDITSPAEIFKVEIEVESFNSPILVDIYDQYAGDINNNPLLSGDCPHDHTIYVSSASALVVRGLDNRIYYRLYNSTSGWRPWSALQTGTTVDSPASAICNNELHIVVRGMDGIGLWHCYVDLSSGTPSGWTWLDGSTPSPPTLTTNGTVLALVVRGWDNRIYYRTYSFAPRNWGGWNVVPAGLTCDGPAAALLGGNLHIVVRGFSTANVNGNNSLWNIIVNPSSGVVRNWVSISGATSSKPDLAVNQTANKLYLIVRGLNNRIYWRTYNATTDSWAEWNVLPTGTTPDGPSAMVADSKLHIVVRGMDGKTLWHCYINLSSGTPSSWTKLDGSTPSPPTLTG
ncbi:C25 family cysteine peptidase [Candidatus Bathyarchaeota archaeon]|nr:C25 family cysteine peptidase [Candidatus Bathyarchaeota archaeon]